MEARARVAGGPTTLVPKRHERSAVPLPIASGQLRQRRTQLTWRMPEILLSHVQLLASAEKREATTILAGRAAGDATGCTDAAGGGRRLEKRVRILTDIPQ
jgi:hypothetical protein